jgi:DUF1365 family protein
VEVERNQHRIFDAELALRRTKLTRWRAITILGRYPMLPLRTSAGIYARATRLLATGARVYRHPSRQAKGTRRCDCSSD